MSYYDLLDIIIELTQDCALLKSRNDEWYSTSFIVERAWPQHILPTGTYTNFSRQHVDVERLHYTLFSAANIEDVKKEMSNHEESGPAKTYYTLFSFLGSTNVNATVWLFKEDQPNGP
jgi:hypothetical protein